VLRSGRFGRLALADPQLAPYGAAAVQTLTPRLVQGESVARVSQFVASGGAEFGFVAASQVFVDGALITGPVAARDVRWHLSRVPFPAAASGSATPASPSGRRCGCACWRAT
jgi:ABC-type molybdate transport system substrate-binding protein